MLESADAKLLLNLLSVSVKGICSFFEPVS
jgi:hypothetical protein